MLVLYLFLYAISFTQGQIGITYMNGDVACNVNMSSPSGRSCPTQLRRVLNRKCAIRHFKGPKTALLGGKRQPFVRRGRFGSTLTFTNSMIIVRLKIGSASPHS